MSLHTGFRGRGHISRGGQQASYPASVVAAGLQNVWDLQKPGAVGIRTATTKTPTTAGAGTWDSSSPPNLYVTSSQTVSNVDFTGWNVLVDSGAVITFNDCVFSGLSNGYKLASNLNNLTPVSITCNYCTFDCATTTAGPSGGVSFGRGVFATTGAFDHCDFKNANGQPLGGSAQMTITNCYFHNYGINPDSTTHIEGYQSGGARSVTINNCVFDVSGAAAHVASYPSGAGWTAAGWYLAAPPTGSATTTAGISNSIIYGVSDILAVNPSALDYTIVGSSAGAPGTIPTVTQTYTNIVLQRGGSNYIDREAATGAAVVIDGGGCRDFDFGFPINLATVT